MQRTLMIEFDLHSMIVSLAPWVWLYRRILARWAAYKAESDLEGRERQRGCAEVPR